MHFMNMNIVKHIIQNYDIKIKKKRVKWTEPLHEVHETYSPDQYDRCRSKLRQNIPHKIAIQACKMELSMALELVEYYLDNPNVGIQYITRTARIRYQEQLRDQRDQYNKTVQNLQTIENMQNNPFIRKCKY